MYRLVGLLYLLSGAWCAIFPLKSAAFLGFGLSGDGALVEFYSVYGGLQVGLGLAIIFSSFIQRYVEACAFFAAIFSLSLVVFRAIAITQFSSAYHVLWMLALESVIALILWAYWFQIKEKISLE